MMVDGYFATRTENSTTLDFSNDRSEHVRNMARVLGDGVTIIISVCHSDWTYKLTLPSIPMVGTSSFQQIAT